MTVTETPEAEAAPNVPTAEASEEDHNAPQQKTSNHLLLRESLDI